MGADGFFEFQAVQILLVGTQVERYVFAGDFLLDPLL